MKKKTAFSLLLVGIMTLTINVNMKTFAEDDIFMPNMHMQLGCESCHQEPAQPGVTKRSEVKLTSPNSDIIVLCEMCHPSQEVHPNGVDPVKTGMKIPNHLPLGYNGGPNSGQVMCTTCHDIHAEFSSGKLLRGFPQKKGDRTRYRQKIDLCKDCHGAELATRSPHKEDEKYCPFCHGADPKQQEQTSTIKLDIISLCQFCHSREKIPHFIKFAGLFSDKGIKEDLKNMKLPLSKNKKLTCATCHNPHGTENKDRHYLRDEFIRLGGKSNKINPHWTDTFCTSCHDKKPEGKTAGFKYNNDSDKTCIWCHKGDEGSTLHPNAVPAKESASLKVSEKMKLVNGNVGCITCHRKDCENNEETTGANFLRGAPYPKRNDICYNCHKKAYYKKINPHRQKNMQGEVDYEICKNCHVGVPDEEKKENLGLIGSELFLCLRCHSDRPHPGTNINTGEGVEHMVIPEEVPGKLVFPQDLRRDKKGRVMCSTCHPSHMEGITSKEEKALLQNDCTICHIGI